jgi:O-antigen ligase
MFLAAFPLSLASPGATIALALIAIYGVWNWIRHDDMPRDIASVGRLSLALYGGLLAIDVLNGGGVVNLTTTGVNYLPLIAIAPFAMSIRQAKLHPEQMQTAVAVTLVLAAASSALQYAFGENRPGGLNMNENPFGFVVLVWSLLMFAVGLERRNARAFLFSAVGLVPALLSGSKTVFVCLFLGLVVLTVLHVRRHGNWRLLPLLAAALAAIAALAYQFVLRTRIDALFAEVSTMLSNGRIGTGDVVHQTLGQRIQLAKGALQVFAERPLLGHGLYESEGHVERFLNEAGVEMARLGHLHNDYLTHLVSFGIPGLVFVILFLALAVGLALRVGDPALCNFGLAFACILATYMLSEVAFNMDPISSVWGILLGSLLAFRSGPGIAVRGASRPASTERRDS